MLNPECTSIHNAKDDSQNDSADLIANRSVQVEGENDSLNSKSRELNDYAVDGVVNSENAIVPAGIFRDSDDDPYSRDGSNYPLEAKEDAHVESQSVHRDIGENCLHKAPFGDPSLVERKVKADHQKQETERRYSNMDESRDGLQWHPAAHKPSCGFDDRECQDEGIPHSMGHVDQYDAEVLRKIDVLRDGSPGYPATYKPSCRFDAHEYQDEGIPYSEGHLDQYDAEVLRRIDDLRDRIIQTHVNRQPSGRRAYPENLRGTSHQSRSHPESRLSLKPHSLQHLPPPNSHGMSMGRYDRMVPDQGEFGYDIPVASPPIHGTHHKSPMYGTHGYGSFYPAPKMSHAHATHPPFSYTQCSGYSRNMSSSYPQVDSGIVEIPYQGHPGGLYPMDFGNLKGSGSHRFRNTGPFRHARGLQSSQKHSFRAPDPHKCPSLAGGTPYISCGDCFELLVLPCGLLSNRDWAKLRCGECSCILVVRIFGKRLKIVESIPADRMEDGLHQAPSSSGSDSIKCHTAGKNAATLGKNVVVSELISPDSKERSGKEHSPKLSEVHNREMDSSSPGTPKKGSSEVKTRHQESKDESTDMTREKPDADSPIHDHVGSSHGVIEYVFGSMAGLPDQRNATKAGDNHPHMSTESATELVLSPNEYPDLSLVSQNGKKDEEELKATKTNGPSSVGLGDREQSQFHSSPEKEICRVSINGHPIHHLDIKEATKKAGPIQPADYWYDYNAGFWGIMGQPCLGIIPPHIKEFNFVMPKDCANGDTGVVVNGRELHRNDLDLLRRRGLPSVRGQSYVVDISGRVEDAFSGAELKNLGKLAPTVEKLGHGFGMRPKVRK